MSSGPLDRTPNPDLDYVFQLGDYTLESIPELPTSQRFKYSAEDVWRWVQSMRREFDQDSFMSKVRRLPRNAIYIEKYGLPESLLDKIFSLRDHTKCLIDRFSSWLELNKDPLRPSLDLPICPVIPLRKGVVINALERLEIILWYLVSTDRHKRRNCDLYLYLLACSLRGYSATLHGITKDVGGWCIGHLTSSWVGETCQKLAKWREDVARVSAVALPDSVPPDWRMTVADVGDLASRIVATILDASGDVKVMTWEPDKESVQRIREAMWRIGVWSEDFSIQADAPPTTLLAVADEKPTAKHDAPAGEYEQLPVVIKPILAPHEIAAASEVAKLPPPPSLDLNEAVGIEPAVQDQFLVPPNKPPSNRPEDPHLLRILQVFTKGVSDERFTNAAEIVASKMTVNEKLTKLDAQVCIPATASAEELGDMLEVTKQAVSQTDWWIQNRKGEKESEIARRKTKHKKRAEDYEPPSHETG